MRRIALDETISKCPECGSVNLLFDKKSGEISCVSCGYVIVPVMADAGPEWRTFDGEKEDTRSRSGAPITMKMHDKGLSTKISWRRRGSREMSKTQLEKLSTLKKWNRRTQVSNSTERNLTRALSELNNICSTLAIPDAVAETASVLYRRAIKHKLVRGRSLRGMAAATVYLACKQCGVVRLLPEVARATSLTKKEVGRCYRLVVDVLSIRTPAVDAKLYVSRFVNNLDLKGDVESLALEILRNAKVAGLTSGRGPIGMAAAATYLASTLLNYRKTQHEVAEIAKVTEVTIRNRYKEMLDKIGMDVFI